MPTKDDNDGWVRIPDEYSGLTDDFVILDAERGTVALEDGGERS